MQSLHSAGVRGKVLRRREIGWGGVVGVGGGFLLYLVYQSGWGEYAKVLVRV